MYLTLLVVTNPVLASNNRGENEGNLQTLQKVRTREGMRTVLSGYAIKRAIRDAMQANGAKMWRRSVDPDQVNRAGYIYGENDSPTLAGAEPKAPEGYDDVVFGYMSAPKGKAEDAVKRAGCVEVSAALSTTPYDGDMAFVQGLKAATPDLAPFSHERHYTRYQFTLTMNLGDLAGQPTSLPYLLDSLRFLRVGGSHASNASELSPAVLAWRFHKAPGRGGLHLGAGLDFLPDESVDLTPLRTRCVDLGLDLNVAGQGADMTIAKALDAIKERAEGLSC